MSEQQLTNAQTEKIKMVKELSEKVGEVVEDLMLDGTLDTRWIAAGKTHLQQGFMAIIRGIAKPEIF